MSSSIRNSTYHRSIRVSAVVCACVLLFESGLLLHSTAQLSVNTHSYLANAIGMSATVEPNELNTLTAELTAQKRALAARELALSEREIEIGLAPGESPNQRATYIMASILFILLILIILNYALDYLRSRERETLVFNEAV